MSTRSGKKRNVSGGVEGSWHLRLTTLPPSMSRCYRQCGILNISQHYRPLRSVTGIALLFCFYKIKMFMFLNFTQAVPHSDGKIISNRLLRYVYWLRDSAAQVQDFGRGEAVSDSLSCRVTMRYILGNKVGACAAGDCTEPRTRPVTIQKVLISKVGWNTVFPDWGISLVSSVRQWKSPRSYLRLGHDLFVTHLTINHSLSSNVLTLYFTQVYW
jgi:hypothetical protein